MEKLKWLVNVNLFDNETGSFWRGPGKDPTQIATEVFFLPCCTSIEKEGSIANSGRWMQWRHAGPKPLGDSKSDGDVICELTALLKAAYAKDGGPGAEAILNLNPDAFATATAMAICSPGPMPNVAAAEPVTPPAISPKTTTAIMPATSTTTPPNSPSNPRRA